MAQLVVRNIENAVKDRLQRRARRNGRSMEEEIFCAAPQGRSRSRRVGWEKKSPACLPRPGSSLTFQSYADTKLSPSILNDDNSGYERALRADAAVARPESCHVARSAASDIGMDHFGDSV